MLKVNVRTDRAGHWLEGSLLHLVDEASSNWAGSEAMLAKVSEALFVDTLRRYVAALPEHHTGWLTGARDPVVSKSLALRCTAASIIRGRSRSWPRPLACRERPSSIDSQNICRSRRWRT